MHKQELLEKVSKAIIQYNAQKERTGADYNIFSVLDVERKEVGTHSRILFSLMSPNGTHRQKDKYLKLFLREIDVPLPLRKRPWQVEREWVFSHGRIDFFLHCPEMCVAIEMKIDAGDQDAQLFRYEQYAKTKSDIYRVCYLTLQGSSPSQQSAQGVNEKSFQNLSFSGHIQRWLTACLEETPASSSAYSFIQQYQRLINKITEEESMSEQISDLIQGADHLRGAIAISNELNNIKAEVMRNLFERIQEECIVLDLHPDYYDDESTNYYSKGKYAPWLCYELKEFGTVGKSQNKKAVTLSICVNWALFMSVELVEIAPDEDDWGVMVPEQFGKRAAGKISAALQSVYDQLEVDKENSNILHWSYIFDSNEEKFDFAQFSESCIRLRDNDHLQLEARRIAERITVEHQRICEALNPQPTEGT
ncbi:MAG: PD-(D/E)XK nuclease family protein [Desulfitobacteriaceae bacterium]|nr:PD-(D/E)XK nuclease family protein [Desulfitobacteriaceae bacterium]